MRSPVGWPSGRLGRLARTYSLLIALLLGACARKGGNPPPLSPPDALKSFRLSEDFKVELFASEPHVVDPVEMAFDENGRVYVADMIDYPEDPRAGKPARSRIMLLEDTDGDGKIDRSTVFADHVLQVSGILPWKGGLLVTSAPEILFLKDTNGDGKADIRRVLYTGFPKVNPEGRITNLRLGIDNWIYAANNGADGRITSPDHPERPPILVRGTDFRFRPDRDLAEPASGPTQFGMTFDDWGNRFLTQNTIHIRHAVLPMQYVMRAPTLEIGAVSQDISDHGRPDVRVFPLTGPQAWRIERTRLRQQRYDENHLNRTEQVGGYFTAASGGTVYTGDVFPPGYVGNVFTGDVNGNLVHRDILTPDGPTFRARRAQDGVEFLASTDPWFRPCNFANAPDGNLYMIDIYREFIETPESIPEEIKKNMDFWSGDDKGRIYRIVPNHPLRTRNLKVSLGSASTAELVKLLESTNGWHRQTAQRLLVDRQDKSAVPLLRALALSSQSPLARVHALWTLEGLSALEPELVLHALQDPVPGVREHALRLSEPYLDSSKPVSEAVLALANDPDARVQFQLALSLGGMKDNRALNALRVIASEHPSDHWFNLAVLTSVHDSASQLFHLLLGRGGGLENPDFVKRLAALIGAKHDGGEVSRFLASLPKLSTPEAALSGLAHGFQLANASKLQIPGAEAALARFLNSPSDEVQRAAWETARYIELRALLKKAEADALASNLPAPKRVVAIRALRGGDYAAAERVVRKLFESPQAPEIQRAAIDALDAFDNASAASRILAYWSGYSPEARSKAIGALLSHRDRVPILLKALEDHAIEPNAIEVAERARLLDYPDRNLAQRARQLLQNESSDRAKVVANYRDVIKMAGDAQRGKQAFEENCAKCHMPRKRGGRVGPDLSGINNKTKEELLTSILNPSYSIEPRFTNYMVTTKDGRLHDGVIASETPGVITLRGGSEEGDDVILRRNIVEIRASSISLMPEGLEKSLGKQGLADVIAYLRGGL